MKQLLIIVILILGLCSYAIGNPVITCPNGNVLDTDHIYKNWVMPDFPLELCNVFCNIPFTAEPMNNYPQIFIGLASISATTEDRILIVWFCDMTTNKYIAFVEYDAVKDKHTILWISEYSPKGLRWASDYDCKRVLAPAEIPESLDKQLREMALAIARDLYLTGIMDVEFIVHNGIVYHHLCYHLVHVEI